MATLIAVSNLTASVNSTVNSDLLASNTPIVIEAKEPSYTQMITVLANKYEVSPNLAIEIARCESELRQFNKDGSVVRGRVNPDDVGLFQINEQWHLADSRKAGFDIHTAKGNIEYAMYIMKKDGARHWNYSKPCWGSKVGNQLAFAK